MTPGFIHTFESNSPNIGQRDILCVSAGCLKKVLQDRPGFARHTRPPASGVRMRSEISSADHVHNCVLGGGEYWKGDDGYLQINREEKQKRIEIWLTNEEKNDPVLYESLKPIFKRYHDRKYMVAVFLSGECDLYEETRALLLYNRRRAAERAIQAECKSQTVHY